MPSSFKSPSFSPSRTSVPGPQFVSGGLFVTGSSCISGNLSVQGCEVVRIGTTLTGMTSSYGIGTNQHTGSAFTIYGSTPGTAYNEAIRMIANLGGLTVDDNYYLVRMGFMTSGSSGRFFTGSWNFKPFSIESDDPSAAEVLGSEADGGSSIGTVVGSSASYSTPGSKLLSVQNGGVEREATYYDGTKNACIDDFGGYIKDSYYSNVVSISGSTLYYMADQVPAGALIKGVGFRILTSFQTASALALGLSSSTGGFTEYWGGSLGYLAGVTNFTGSLKSGYVYTANDISVCLSSSVLQGNTSGVTGSVRITAYYQTIQCPTG